MADLHGDMVRRIRVRRTVRAKVSRGQAMTLAEIGGLYLAAFAFGVVFGMKLQAIVAFFRGATDV